MNKTTEYIDALLLSDREKAALPKTDIRAVHQALDAEHRTYSREDDSPQGSVKARLEHAWPDSLAKGQLIKDDEGRDQLQAMPKATRSSMFPDPWRTNPVGRFWDRLRGRDVTPRYVSRLTKEEQASEQKWRTVGTIRRYILLILTLAQTVVATWYMKTILPYQGWALINPMDMVGQDIWVSFMQLLPYMLQTGILILFAVLFCWVSAGFWTALMGFLQLLIGRDKYSISASTVGDEPLNPEHRTALIMLSVMKTLVAFSPVCARPGSPLKPQATPRISTSISLATVITRISAWRSKRRGWSLSRKCRAKAKFFTVAAAAV